MLIPDDEFEQRQPPEPLIEGILDVGAEAKLVGESGAAKSFVTTSLAFSIATGQPWLGKYPVKRGLVVYILLEGAGGFPKRIRAWKRAQKVKGCAGVYLLPESVQMVGRESDDLDDLLEAITALPEPPVLIVIDTQNRAMEGREENTSKDLSNFLGAVSRIREETGAAVLIVHHTGWDGNRERGHSSQRGAADTVMLIEEQEDEDGAKGLTLQCIKQKDREKFDDIALQLVPVNLGTDENGKPITSCVVELATPQPKKLSPKAATALRALSEFGEKGATPTVWEQKADLGSNSTFRRARGDLERAGLITTPPKKRGALVTLTDASRAAVETFPAAPDGGVNAAPNGGFPGPRQTPPLPRHGGDRPTTPPRHTPFGGDGVAGSARRPKTWIRITPAKRDNAGALRPARKHTEKSPDYAGAIALRGLDYRLSAWARQTKDGGAYLAVRASDDQGGGALFQARGRAKQDSYAGDLTIAGVTYHVVGRRATNRHGRAAVSLVALPPCPAKSRSTRGAPA